MRGLSCRVVVVALTSGVVAVASGQDAPPIARFVPGAPDPAHVFVMDSARLLSPAALHALQDSARALQTETAADVAWITLPTLGGRPIEEAALYVGRTWRIGSAGTPGDPLRNRGLVILYVPDKTKTAGSNFRVEVGNGLEGTITDSRSRTISAAMRDDLRAKHYDAAYLSGWRVAAALVREDFASHGEAGRAAAAEAAARRPPVIQQDFGSTTDPGFVLVAVIVIVVGLIVSIAIVRRGASAAGIPITPPIPNTDDDDDDDARRRSGWMSTSSDSGADFGGSSSSDGGSFGDGGGFSGGGSSDTI